MNNIHTTEFNDDDIKDDRADSSEFYSDKEKSNPNKLDTRRKLEDYLEKKRLEKELSYD